MKINYMLLLLLLMSFSFGSNAQTKTWVGPTNGSWGVAANWSPTGVPSSQDVIIPSGSEVNIDVGANAGNLTVESNAVLHKTSSLSLTLQTGIFEANSTLNFEEGNINASVIFNGEVNIMGPEPKGLFGINTINDVMNIESGVFNFSSGSSAILTISPSGVMTVGDASITNASFGATIRNEGLIQKTSGSGTFTFNQGIGLQNINGNINVDSGSMIIGSQSDFTNGTYNVNSGGSLTFGPSNNNDFIGTLTGQLDGPFIINGGILLTSGEDVTYDFSGTAGVEWAGGALSGGSGDAALINQGLITVTGGGNSATQISGSYLRNNGTLIFEENISFSLSGANALLENTSAGIITVNDGFTTTSAGGANYVNEGLLQKTEGTGDVNFQAVIENNAPGIIAIQTGNISFTTTFTGNGRITGAGSISTSNDEEIGQTIAPGNDGVGTLTYNNVLDFEATADCIYQLEINGTTPGTEHDVFAINTKARLNGELDVILSFDAQIDDEFVIMTFPEIMECNLPAQVTSVFDGSVYTYDVVCNDDNVTLRVNAVTLGVQDQALASATLFPNPTTGIVNIDLKKAFAETTVTVRNILGQQISSEILNNQNSAEFDVLGAPGMYFVTVITSENSTKTFKVIKK